VAGSLLFTKVPRRELPALLSAIIGNTVRGYAKMGDPNEAAELTRRVGPDDHVWVLLSGGASITLKSGGEITIKGTDITIDGSGKIGIKAGGDVAIKGSKIGAN
jgi:hypothetical protein